MIIIRSHRRSELCLQNLIRSDRGEVNIFYAVTSAIIGIAFVALAILLLTMQHSDVAGVAGFRRM